MNVVVLAGGTSTEREISIVSSTMICKALRKNGHNAAVIDVFFGYENDFGDCQDVFCENLDLDIQTQELKNKSLKVKDEMVQRKEAGEGFFGPHVIELCKASDIVFIGLHGENGEDGRIQAAFDLLGIKYTGTGFLSSAVSMDKAMAKNLLLAAGIPMPKGISVHKEDKVRDKINFPCVVKPCCGGSSVGVYIVNNETEYEHALEEAFKLEPNLIVEEYVKGREFSVAVLDGKALPVIEIAPVDGFYDYKNKYVAGMTIETCPAEIPKEISEKMQFWAAKACEMVGLQVYGRVDILMNESEEIFCLEVNTLPGMTPTSLIPQEAAAVGISYEELCDKIMEISLKKYK